ncbi:hypothetical protein ACC695_38420, partial [Rhizobium ruizarguesonis]
AGRPAPRRSLYIAALSARRYNPALALFADTLKAAGKPAKVILVAIMRKLLVLGLLRILAPDNEAQDQWRRSPRHAFVDTNLHLAFLLLMSGERG